MWHPGAAHRGREVEGWKGRARRRYPVAPRRLCGQGDGEPQAGSSTAGRPSAGDRRAEERRCGRHGGDRHGRWLLREAKCGM